MRDVDDPGALKELEHRLRDLSHNIDALQTVREFAEGLRKTKERQTVFNAEGALVVRPPITYDAGRERGLIPDTEDAFILLQGDVISTETAYHMGARLTARMRFLVANSTCDLVPGRRNFASLLPIQPILPGATQEEQETTKRLLSELLRFASTRRMYLPPLPGDPAQSIGNAVEFDRIAQARLEDVLAAERIASLSLVGWRIFGSHLRAILSRTGENEVSLRNGWI